MNIITYNNILIAFVVTGVILCLFGLMHVLSTPEDIEKAIDRDIENNNQR